jgi:hypothetical protein
VVVAEEVEVEVMDRQLAKNEGEDSGHVLFSSPDLPARKDLEVDVRRTRKEWTRVSSRYPVA